LPLWQEKISDQEINIRTTEADLKYRKYINTIQPRVVAVNINMNIFPESPGFNSAGEYLLINNNTIISKEIFAYRIFDELLSLA
jgi:ABC-2 type transport system permease protein